MKAAAGWVLCALCVPLTGCFHKQQQQQPQQVAPELAQTPPPAPAPAIATPLPPENPNVAPNPATIPSSAAAATPAPEQAAKSVEHHSRHPDKPTPEPQDIAKTPAVTAIGQLSTGEPGTETKDVEDSIAATEYGLKQITRPLSTSEQKTVAQIREFLKQARAALDSGDSDGAGTLALKAKVLLSELSK
jgi:hypothetical protein